MSVVVDLITPPGSPVRNGGQWDDGPVDLCTPSPSPSPCRHDEATKRADEATKRAREASEEQEGAPSKKKSKATGRGEEKQEEEKNGEARWVDDDDDDDSDDDDDDSEQEDLAEVAAPARQMRSLEPAAPGDDDVVFAGSCGDDALRDFPHARENCLEKPFVAGGEHLCCANCFCCARPGSQPVPPSCNVALALNAQVRARMELVVH